MYRLVSASSGTLGWKFHQDFLPIVFRSSSSSSSGARSETDIGGHASTNISVIRQLKKI